MVNPGRGYRLLTRYDLVQPGDEVYYFGYSGAPAEWLTPAAFHIGLPAEVYFYRRKLTVSEVINQPESRRAISRGDDI